MRFQSSCPTNVHQWGDRTRNGEATNQLRKKKKTPEQRKVVLKKNASTKIKLRQVAKARWTHVVQTMPECSLDEIGKSKYESAKSTNRRNRHSPSGEVSTSQTHNLFQRHCVIEISGFLTCKLTHHMRLVHQTLARVDRNDNLGNNVQITSTFGSTWKNNECPANGKLIWTKINRTCTKWFPGAESYPSFLRP